MTALQEQLGETIIDLFKSNNGKYNLFTIIAPKLQGFKHEEYPFINAQLDIVKHILEERKYIEPFQNSQIMQMRLLTEKGWNFKNFEEEKKKYVREEYMKKNAYWRAKYWWVIAMASVILGWVLKIIQTKL